MAWRKPPEKDEAQKTQPLTLAEARKGRERLREAKINQRVMDLPEKKQKFIENLITIGSLLAVFLGFVADKTGGLILGYLIAFGVVFAVSAFFSYTAGLFKERVTGSFRVAGVRVAYLGLALSFGGLVSYGTAGMLAFLIPSQTNQDITFTIAGVIFVAAFMGVYWTILRVMEMKEVEVTVPEPSKG